MVTIVDEWRSKSLERLDCSGDLPTLKKELIEILTDIYNEIDDKECRED